MHAAKSIGPGLEASEFELRMAIVASKDAVQEAWLVGDLPPFGSAEDNRVIAAATAATIRARQDERKAIEDDPYYITFKEKIYKDFHDRPLRNVRSGVGATVPPQKTRIRLKTLPLPWMSGTTPRRSGTT